MNTQNAYPLSWPPAWKRSQTRATSNFANHSVAETAAEILRQLGLLGVPDQNVVISTNIELRLDGLPRSNGPQVRDPGVAVYFKLKGRDCVLACDKWAHVEDNLWAIAKDIEAQRGRIRWGVGSVEQAFAGYTALPAPGESGAPAWYNVLGVPVTATIEQARSAYIAMAQAAHPDKGGSNEAMHVLNSAWDQARKALAA